MRIRKSGAENGIEGDGFPRWEYFYEISMAKEEAEEWDKRIRRYIQSLPNDFGFEAMRRTAEGLLPFKEKMTIGDDELVVMEQALHQQEGRYLWDEAR